MPADATPQISTPSDVQAAFDRDVNSDRFFETPETVTLPSGLVFLMRRPKPEWFIRKFRRLPQGLAQVVENGGEESMASGDLLPKEELMKWVHLLSDMVRQVVVQPRISLTPGPDEISSDVITDPDAQFIWKWAAGQAGGAGADLETFRPGQVGAITPASENGGDVLVPSVELSGVDGNSGVATG